MPGAADKDGRPTESEQWRAAVEALEHQRTAEPFDLNREVRALTAHCVTYHQCQAGSMLLFYEANWVWADRASFVSRVNRNADCGSIRASAQADGRRT